MGATEWQQMLDSRGCLISQVRFCWLNVPEHSCQERLRLVVYVNGVEPSMRHIVWPFLLNLYPSHTTAEERKMHEANIEAEYVQLRDAWRHPLKFVVVLPKEFTVLITVPVRHRNAYVSCRMQWKRTLCAPTDTYRSMVAAPTIETQLRSSIFLRHTRSVTHKRSTARCTRSCALCVNENSTAGHVGLSVAAFVRTQWKRVTFLRTLLRSHAASEA